MAELSEGYNFASDTMDRWAEERPDARALWHVCPTRAQETVFTFQELAEQGRRAAGFFRGCGILPGSRVLVMLPRVPAWWIGMLGLIRMGAVPIPTSLQLTPREVQQRLQTAEVSAVVMDAEHTGSVGAFPGVRIVVGGEAAGWLGLEAGVRATPPDFVAEPTRREDPGIMYFTSATAGEPKMVLHTQVSYALGHEVTGKLWLDLQPGDVQWTISDVGWGKAAWSSFYGPWQAGACVFAVDTRGRFDPAGTLDTLSRYPVTHWCAPPTALRMIVREDLARWKFPHLRHCVSAGESLNPEVVAAWARATGLTIYEGYGQTETVILIGNFRSHGRPVRPGSMGHPAPGYEVALLDEHLQEVGIGHEGEIAIRVTPRRPLGLLREYWKNPAENAAHFRGDWYLTGDCARRDDDGYFWFIGRRDDVIKSSGYRIGPSEVEEALLEHPAVLEAAVVGKPDALRGQIVKAFVVLRPGTDLNGGLKEALQEHCARLVAPYKKPREIEFVNDLPRTISSKVQRRVLRARG